MLMNSSQSPTDAAIDGAVNRIFGELAPTSDSPRVQAAAEMKLAASTAAEIVAESILCRECGKVGPQGRMSSGALIPICAACKADADGAAEAQLRAACAAFNAAAKATCARIDAAHDRNQEYMSDGREGRDSFDRYCNEGDDE
jgi:hypothetical protein